MRHKIEAKDYVGFENTRNKRNAALYCAMIQHAFGKDQDVLVGHHINFQTHGQISTITEIPSADTILFDHDVMMRIFGKYAYGIMSTMALLPCDGDARENVCREALKLRGLSCGD